MANSRKIDQAVARFRQHFGWVMTGLAFLGVAVFGWVYLIGGARDATSLTIGVAGLSAYFSFLGTLAVWRQASEAQKQREMSEQPNVIVYFDASWHGILYLVITNVGNAPATDVEIRFEPAFDVQSGASINDIS